jgi:G3E family GTPase
MITTTGCICCTASSDVRSSLFELFEANRTGAIPYFSRVIIETTGLADPAPIINALTPGAIQAFGLRDHVVAKRFRLASIICCVDAITGEASLNHAFEAIKQVAFASSILVTKTDLLSSDASIKINHVLKEKLASINPAAQTLERDTTGSFFMRCFEETYSPKHQSEDILGWLAIERLSQPHQLVIIFEGM